MYSKEELIKFLTDIFNGKNHIMEMIFQKVIFYVNLMH